MATKQVLSPLPGIFYRKPDPDSEAFKNDGDAVAVGDVIGLVEVMKTFHEIKSDADGTVTRFLIENEGAVMAGQAILEVE